MKPEELISAEQIFDVAIIGYGPTGATLANLLAQEGHQVLVIEREADIYNLPRAVHFDDETMRVFQTVGIAEKLSQRVHINPGMKFQDNNDNVLLDWPRDQHITAHGWHASYRLHQPDLETLLRQKLNQKTNVHEALECQAQTLKDNSDHVEITCNNKVFKARYVVGCDGANSLVRKSINDDMKDFGFRERWLVVDVILNKPRPDLGDHSIQFCDSQRPMTYCRNPGLRRRWEITILKDESDEEIRSEERVWELLARWISQYEAQLERSAVYTFRSAIARQWHSGRLLIAGDAAHLTPPFMGQGMCMGIRDAANLAWKLTEVLKSGRGNSLLKSYQAERSPHAQAYIETAIRLGGLINSMDSDSALQMAQNQSNNDQSKGETTIKSIQPKLGASSHLHSLGEQPENSVGLSFAQPLLNSGTVRFDELAGCKHALITRKSLQNKAPEGFIALSADDQPSLETELDKLGANAVWVRPDRYIGAIANSSEALLKQLPKTYTVNLTQ